MVKNGTNVAFLGLSNFLCLCPQGLDTKLNSMIYREFIRNRSFFFIAWGVKDYFFCFLYFLFGGGGGGAGRE